MAYVSRFSMAINAVFAAGIISSIVLFVLAVLPKFYRVGTELKQLKLLLLKLPSRMVQEVTPVEDFVISSGSFSSFFFCLYLSVY